MGLITRHWEPDGLDALSPRARMALSVVVTGIAGFLLEYIGINVAHAFTNPKPYTIYVVTGIWALGLGPLLVALRKASMIVPMLIVGIIFGILVLFNQYHYVEWVFAGGTFKDSGRLVQERLWEFRDGAIFGLKNPILIALVAGAIETVVVPVSLIAQKLLTSGLKKPPEVSVEAEADLFSSSVNPLADMKPKRDFGFLLMRFIFLASAVYFSYQIIGLLVRGKSLPVVDMLFFNPPETVNTLMKISFLFLLGNTGAFNAKIRKQAAQLLFAVNFISVSASLWLYFAFPVNPLFPADHQFLLTSIAGDGVILALLAYLIIKLRSKGKEITINDVEVNSPAATLLKSFFLVFGILFTIYFLGIIYFRAFADPTSAMGAVFGGPDPLVSNSITKYGTLAVFGYFLYARPELRRFFIPILITGFAISVTATILYGLHGSTVILNRDAQYITIPYFMMLHVIVDGGGLILIITLRRLQYNVDYQVASLEPDSAECVMALHRALRESEQEPESSDRDALNRIDEHIAGIHGRRRGLLAFPFWLIEFAFPVLAWFRPPFSTMSREEQRWMLRKYMLRPSYERARSIVPGLADLFYQVGDIANAFLALAYFTSPRAHSQVGYVPPDARQRLQPDITDDRPTSGSRVAKWPSDRTDSSWTKPPTKGQKLPLLAPSVDVQKGPFRIPDVVDYCVVGSGAAGAIVAYRLAESSPGASICVVEQGGYYNPSQDFSDDELRMIRTLYAEGGLQVSRSFDFTILQGQCVGGTTVINNAVCFQMPDVSRREWEGFGIDVGGLESHYQRVKSEINIDTVTDRAVNQDVEELFIKGVHGYNTAQKWEPLSEAERVLGNFTNCIGCGLCNIGCKRIRKLSMLETYIPWAQGRGAIVSPNLMAVRAETELAGPRRRVTALTVLDSSGQPHKIKINRALVVSAGAIASSRFLLRSGLGGPGVGLGLACNFAIPPLVEFDRELNAFDGLQMTLFAHPRSHDAVFETTFFPPGSYSITLPLYFARHYEMMQAYRRTAYFTALVGSDPAGTVSAAPDLIFGRPIQWEPTKDDVKRMKDAMVTIVRMSRAAGARRVWLPTHPVLEVDLDSQPEALLERMDRVIVNGNHINLATAHPQGGNLMAGDSMDKRVVDLDFRVRDTDNLYVCDASVFPRGIRVNPQWTIMALASRAGEIIGQTE